MTAKSPSAGTAVPSAEQSNRLRVRRLGVDTQYETVVFMRTDCHVCRSEGLTAHSRVHLSHDGRSVIATLYQVSTDMLAPGEAGLSESTWTRLGLEEGDEVAVSHPRPLDSLGMVRGKIHGRPLSREALSTIIRDVTAGRYSDIHLAAFITACSARPLDREEILGLTAAMVEVGDRLTWPMHPVVDKHSVGGLPGNRTTPIVVAIVTACGLIMPKTSSRAITSPAGTADTMETLAPVDLDIPTMRRVVEQEGGCIVWGGAVGLSPADDVLIRVERAIDLDPEGQLVASVLSKKIAAGSSHLVLDIPVGPTAKVRGEQAAASLSAILVDVAAQFGLKARALIGDGTQPVGRGIGPALEARDVLAVLQNAPDAPADLRARAVALAGTLIELAGAAPDGKGRALAAAALADGRAWAKFQRICAAQGGMREPPMAAQHRPVVATRAGRIGAVDNRRLAKIAKLAGAPDDKVAGLEVKARIGDRVELGDPLFVVHAETWSQLAYAMTYVEANGDIMAID